MITRSIEQFLRRYRVSPTRFGRLVARDPRLVLDIRMGREPRGAMEERIRGFIAGYEAGSTDTKAHATETADAL